VIIKTKSENYRHTSDVQSRGKIKKIVKTQHESEQKKSGIVSFFLPKHFIFFFASAAAAVRICQKKAPQSKKNQKKKKKRDLSRDRNTIQKKNEKKDTKMLSWLTRSSTAPCAGQKNNNTKT